MRPDLNFNDLEVKPPRSPGLLRALILSGSALVLLIAVVLISVKVIGTFSGDDEAATASLTEKPEAAPQMEEAVPEPPVEPEMVVAASSAILERPQDVELEIQIIEGQSTPVEGVSYVKSPIPDGDNDAFAAFLEMEAESLRASETTDDEMSDHTAAVLADIELQLEPLNPLDDDLAQPVTVDTLLEPEINELEVEDDVAVGLVFSKPEGGDLTLNGKPAPKPALPTIKPKLNSSSSDSKKEDSKPFSGLFKSRDKKDEDSKGTIWDRSRDN